MNSNLIILLLCSVSIKLNATAFPNLYPKIKPEKIGDNPGLPLFLTPLITQGKIQDALVAAEVYFNGFKQIKSFSGYLTVNEQFNSNLFFWFFPSRSQYKIDPVILWLQGGPGASSLIGLFAENGPFSVMSKHGLKLRKYSWVDNHSVLYIDNPVGAGYSFTEIGGYCQNETQVAEDLYSALLQFFLLFSELRTNDFFISGESYGGKFASALAFEIHTKNPTAIQKINLKGVSIGNGLIDPLHQLQYGEYLYQLGLVDHNGCSLLRQNEEEAKKLIQNGEWDKAYEVFANIIDGTPSQFGNLTGFVNTFNFLYSEEPSQELVYMGKYVQRDDVRAACHVGNATFHGEGGAVEEHLRADVMQSVAPWIAQLLGHYRFLIYNGQLDIIMAYPLTVNFLENCDFPGADLYKTATRYRWYVDGDLAGYAKQVWNLTEVLVRNAGHMVPKDQPKWAWDLITRFTRNKPFH